MVIVATGISGAGKKEYLNRFEEYATKLGKKVKIYHVGERMLERAKADGLRVTEENILNSNKHTLKALRNTVFESTFHEYEKDKEKYDVIIINIHGFFYWKKTFRHSYDHSYVGRFNPDVFITIMGHPQDIQKELNSRPQWKEEQLSMQEIFMWENVETEVMATWAGLDKKPFYAFYHTQSLATLYKIAFLPEMEKVYLSIPMTYVTDPKDNEKIKAFAKKLEKYFTVFVPDPLKGDLPRINDGLSDENATAYTISHQTVRVDFELLLNQSDRIIVFFPKPLPSPGVVNELREAHETNKGAWVVFPSDIASPFFTYFLDKSFPTEEALFTFIEKEKKDDPRFTEELN